MKTFTITLHNEQVGLTVDSPTNTSELLTVLFTAALSVMQTTVAGAPEAEQDLIRGELADAFNSGATSVLETFDPERQEHPDLTTQAILEAENAILERYKLEVNEEDTY